MFANFSAEEIFLFVVCPAVLVAIGLIAVVEYCFLKPRRELGLAREIARSTIRGTLLEARPYGVESDAQFLEVWNEIREAMLADPVPLSNKPPFYLSIIFVSGGKEVGLRDDTRLSGVFFGTELEVFRQVVVFYDRLKPTAATQHLSRRRLQFEVWERGRDSVGCDKPLWSQLEPEPGPLLRPGTVISGHSLL